MNILFCWSVQSTCPYLLQFNPTGTRTASSKSVAEEMLHPGQLSSICLQIFQRYPVLHWGVKQGGEVCHCQQIQPIQ